MARTVSSHEPDFKKSHRKTIYLSIIENKTLVNMTTLISIPIDTIDYL
jgi:hypothetical protein